MADVCVKPDDRYLAYMGVAPKRIPHWEQWACPGDEAFRAAWARRGVPSFG